MVKSVIRDIIPPSRRSIRHITLSGRGSSRNEEPRVRRPSSGRRGIGLFASVVVIIIVLAGVIAATTFFSSATVRVSPKNSVVPINMNITAAKNETEGDLPFQYAVVGKTFSESVPATGKVFEETRASGRIVIYNNYSAQSQRLVKNTRFETPAGLIYRIEESVTIPGRHSVGGQTVPGSVEVIVYADQPGPKYNIGLTDFTIPGFANDSSRFKGFYARSKTSMTGGFSGEVSKVSADVLDATRKSLRQKLLLASAEESDEKLPESAVFFEGSMYPEFLSLPTAESGTGGGNAIVAESASTTVVFFDREKISSYLASRNLPGYNGEPIVIANFDELVYTSLDRDDFSPAGAENVRFHLNGEAEFVYVYNENKLRDDLVSKNKKDISDVLSTYPSILKTEVVIRPFWRSSFPKNPEKIYILNQER